MSAPKSGNDEHAFVELSPEHCQFVQALIGAVHERTGIRLSKSSVVLSLIDFAMGLDFGGVDFDEQYHKAQTLCALSATRRAIEQEIRRTEADLHQALVHSSADDDAVKNFRRNLRYQSARLSSLLEQVDQCKRHNGNSANGAAHVVHMFLARHLETG